MMNHLFHILYPNTKKNRNHHSHSPTEFNPHGTVAKVNQTSLTPNYKTAEKLCTKKKSPLHRVLVSVHAIIDGSTSCPVWEVCFDDDRETFKNVEKKTPSGDLQPRPPSMKTKLAKATRNYSKTTGTRFRRFHSN